MALVAKIMLNIIVSLDAEFEITLYLMKVECIIFCFDRKMNVYISRKSTYFRICLMKVIFFVLSHFFTFVPIMYANIPDTKILVVSFFFLEKELLNITYHLH